MSLFCDRPFLRLALIGVTVASLMLAGCGRKGPLDPPPSASLASEPQANQPAPVGAADPLVAPIGQTRDNTSGQPQATPGPNKRIFLDSLLN